LRALLRVPSFKLASGKVRLTVSLPLWMTRSSIWAMNMVKTFLVPYANTMCIMEKGQPCVVPVKREIGEGKIKMLSTLQHTKGIKKKESTFLAHKLDQQAKKVQTPKATQKVLDESRTLCPPSYL